MDNDDLASRAIAVMSQVYGGAASAGSEDLLAQVRDLQNDLETAAQAAPLGDELRDLQQALGLMAQTLSDPAELAQIAELAATPYVPAPEIFNAIDMADLDAIRSALVDWDINQGVGEYQSTALYHAMSDSGGASIAVMNLLLDEGADPNKGLTQTNVLHGLGFANLNGIKPEDLAEVIKRCIALGADIEQPSDKLGWTPLIGAASEWNPIAVEALLLAGADITAISGDVEGVCFAQESSMAFADGSPETLAVLQRFARPN